MGDASLDDEKARRSLGDLGEQKALAGVLQALDGDEQVLGKLFLAGDDGGEVVQHALVAENALDRPEAVEHPYGHRDADRVGWHAERGEALEERVGKAFATLEAGVDDAEAVFLQE